MLRVVFVGALLLAACGDDDDDGGGGGEDGAEEGIDPAAVVAANSEVGEADPTCEGTSDGVLRIGSLLPATGDLAVLGPAMFAAADLAVADVNGAGGVNGQPVGYERGDEGGSSAEAVVEGHLDARADAILGAASTTVSEEQFDTIIDACRVMFSPANTGANFTIAEDDGLYFRTAPSDLLQGQVLAQIAVEDGITSAAILARDDGYGESLSFFVREQLEANGIDVAPEHFYDPDPDDPAAEVQPVVEADPEGVFVIGYEETSGLIQALRDQGFTPDAKRIYLADGNTTNTVGAEFAETGALAGIRGTYPAAQVAAPFTERLTTQDPAIVDVVYAPETYDAVVITALAAVAAGTDQPDAVAREINGVTREGTACTSFAQCRDLLDAGTDIDYNGPSGLLDFALPGEPTTATIAILSFGANNRIDTAATQYRNVAIGETAAASG
ncbi:MAG: ABC transporter substrate-binding protein [Acidimicrobiales bacterium]